MGWIHHWIFTDYWLPTWPNAGAIPLCVVVGGIGGWIFRKPLKRLWLRFRDHLHEPVRAELAEIRAIAEKGRKIAADTHKALTGMDHPDAPKSEQMTGGTP
jgi:hypothetical protein